jgi:DNA-binding CsgD family transcriptional regulator
MGTGWGAEGVAMRDATGTAEWLGLAADLVSEHSETWQATRINQQLVETFEAAGSAYCDQELELWPADRFAGQLDDIARWCTRQASAEHPILRYFLTTGDWRVMQVTDVPTRIVSTAVTAAWIERGRRWGGVQHQLAMPLARTRRGRRAFVVGRPDPFTAAEMDLARQLRRLIAGLDRHRTAFARWSRGAGPAGPDTARDIRLTPRELAVLALLAEGLTAASIGRRLMITERTVHKHLQHSYTKLGVTDRLGAVLHAQRMGLLPAA